VVWNRSDHRSLYRSGSLGPFLLRWMPPPQQNVRMPVGVATPYRRRPEAERKLSVSVKKTQDAAHRTTKAAVRMRFSRVHLPSSVRRGEDGEREDRGCREEHVQARRAAEDQVEEHDEAPAIVVLVILVFDAWCICDIVAGLVDEDLAFFLLRH